MSNATKGRLAAAIMFTLVAGLIAFAALRDRGRPVADGAPAQSVGREVAPPSTEVVDSGISVGTIQNVVELGERGNWSRMNEVTGELEMRLTWDRLTPEAAGRFTIEQPSAWVWLDEARVHVRADQGQLLWPAREHEEPESGELTGNIVITIYEPAEPGLEADAQTEVIGSLKTGSLRFESALGQIETDDVVVADGPGLLFRGEGLTLRFSEVQRRLQFARVDRGEILRLNPDRARRPAKRNDTQPVEESDGRRAASTTPGPDEGTGRIDLYHAVISDNVTLSHGDRLISSEQISGWARLIDGRFQLQSLSRAEIDSDEDPAATGSSGVAAPRPMRPDDASTDEIVLRWSGPIEIRPLREAPRELFDDDLFVRFDSPSSNIVTLLDQASRARAECVSLNLGATRRHISLLGIGGSHGVSLSIPDQAEVRAARLDLEFADDFKSGVGAFVGAGIAEASEEAQRETSVGTSRNIRWSGRCDFAFEQTDRGTIIPKQVIFADDVIATDAGSFVRGESMQTVFSTWRATGSDAPTPYLSRLTVRDSALADAGEDGSIAADELNLTFAPVEETDEVTPVSAGAVGNVRAERDGHRLEADRLFTDLRRTPRKEIEIVQVEVEGDISILTENQILVRADNMLVDQLARSADLTGPTVSISRRGTEDSFDLRGTSIRIEESERRITVFGEGTLEYAKGSADLFDYDRMKVDWRDGMVFSDLLGEGVFLGGIKATGQSREGHQHLGQGDRLLVRVSPYEQTVSSGHPRELLLVELEGTTREGELADRASFESRIFKIGVEPRTLEALVYMEGNLLRADAASGRLDVPGAGMLLVEDRRDEVTRPAGESNESGLELQNLSGTSIFEWSGDFSLDRAQGRAEMDRRVRLRHLHRGNELYTELECEQMTADFLVVEAAGDERTLLELRSVTADDAVFVNHGTLQIICDTMNYIADSGQLTTIARPGNRLTVYDEAKGVHFTADEASVNLSTGRWTTRGMGPVRLPDSSRP